MIFVWCVSTRLSDNEIFRDFWEVFTFVPERVSEHSLFIGHKISETSTSERGWHPVEKHNVSNFSLKFVVWFFSKHYRPVGWGKSTEDRTKILFSIVSNL